MKRGIFVAFEGIDGSGKSTQIRLLEQNLEEKGITPYLTREPTDGEVGRLIRECLAGRTLLDEKAIAALFVADRLDHLSGEDGLKARVERGEFVITDRYYLSSYAYHGTFLPMEWVIAANSLAASTLRPDLTVFIDVDPEQAIERIEKRGERERYEKLESLKRIRKTYFDAMEMLKGEERFAVISGENSIADIQSAIRSEIDKLL